MSDDPSRQKATDAPCTYNTPRRPGQPGEQEQRRPGPSPLSGHATGPHPSYEPDDTDGLSAGRHVREPETPHAPKERKVDGGLGENFTIVGRDVTPG